MAKKEISTGRKIFNGVALIGLIGGVVWLGVKFGGQFPAANALPGLQNEVSDLGMASTIKVFRNNVAGDTEGGGAAVAQLSEQFEKDFEFRQDIINSRWDSELAYRLMTENSEVGNLITTAGKAASIDLNRNYEDYEFEDDRTYTAIQPMSMIAAHAGHQAFTLGDPELAAQYYELAWNLATSLGKEPFQLNQMIYSKAIEDVYRYSLEMLDENRGNPEALKIATDVFARELTETSPTDVAMAELFKTRMAARTMGAEATRYHMSAANWFKKPPEPDDPDLDMDPDTVRTWYGLPWGPKASDLVEIQVLKDMLPMLKDIATYNGDIEKINARVAQFQEAFPDDPPPDLTGVTPRVFKWTPMQAAYFENPIMRQKAGRGVCQVIAVYQQNGNVFPEGMELSDGLSYRKTNNGFRVSVDGTPYGYNFPMPEVTMQSEAPAAAAGGG